MGTGMSGKRRGEKTSNNFVYDVSKMAEEDVPDLVTPQKYQ